MKIAICDDEKIHRETIVKYLKPFQTEENNITAVEFESGEEVVSHYKNGECFDLIFLDVEMTGITGVDAGKLIREMDKNVIIIFVTSYQKYVPDAFRLNAFQFLIKPVKFEDFEQELSRVILSFNKNKQNYIIKYKDKVDVIKISDIVYMEVFNHNLNIHTLNKVYTKPGKLKDEFEKLEDFDFVKCHKSIIVNMRYIKSIEDNRVILAVEQEIQVSRNLKSDVMKSFNFYLSGCSI